MPSNDFFEEQSMLNAQCVRIQDLARALAQIGGIDLDELSTHALSEMTPRKRLKIERRLKDAAGPFLKLGLPPADLPPQIEVHTSAPAHRVGGGVVVGMDAAEPWTISQVPFVFTVRLAVRLFGREALRARVVEQGTGHLNTWLDTEGDSNSVWGFFRGLGDEDQCEELLQSFSRERYGNGGAPRR